MAIGRLLTETDLLAFVRRELNLPENLRGRLSLFVQCTGTPEAQVVAPVGAIAQRLDGGAGTTFYVKESGVGNTGWVAK